MPKITNYTLGIYAQDIWPNIPNIIKGSPHCSCLPYNTRNKYEQGCTLFALLSKHIDHTFLVKLVRDTISTHAHMY